MSQSRSAEITAVAERLFSRQGYHATSMRQVAREMDLQGGSLYSHITGKSALLEAIVERAADRFQAAMDEVRAAEASPPERLRLALRAHVAVVTENRQAARVYFHDWRHLSPDRQARIARRRDAYEAQWREIVAEGVTSGDFRGVEPRTAALACLSLCNWIPQWYDPEGPMSPRTIADAFGDLILNGLCAGPTDASSDVPAGERTIPGTDDEPEPISRRKSDER